MAHTAIRRTVPFLSLLSDGDSGPGEVLDMAHHRGRLRGGATTKKK